LKESPKRQQFIYTLAGLKIQLNKVDEAEALYKRAISDYDRIGESWWRLALLYSVTNRMNEAIVLLDEAKEKGIVLGVEGDSVLADILERAKVKAE